MAALCGKGEGLKYLYFLFVAVIVSCGTTENYNDTTSKNIVVDSDMTLIRRTFEKNKTSIFNKYQELRKEEPNLQGGLKFKLAVSQNGKIIS